MKKTWRMLTRTPRTAEELRYRTTARVGAMGIGALVLFVAIKIILAIWPVLLVLGFIAGIVWVVKRSK
jgi:hypothetical protein